MKNEIRKEVSNQVTYLGDSELALAIRRAGSNDMNAIVAEIQKHRAQFEQHLTASIGRAASRLFAQVPGLLQR
jgi:hypothetical protein